MSYLEDPRVFYAIERTLLAWMRTEIAVLAFAFLIKRFALSMDDTRGLEPYVDSALMFLCGLVIIMSVLSLVQCYFSIDKLGPKELPSRSAKSVVLFTGLTGILLTVFSSWVILIV